MNNLSDVILDAAKAHFQGELKVNQANLKIYLANAAGIGEHSEVVQEVICLLKKITEAKDCLDLIGDL